MSAESLHVFNNPTESFHQYSEEPYPVQVPLENSYYDSHPRRYGNSDNWDNKLMTINISHRDDGPVISHSFSLFYLAFSELLSRSSSCDRSDVQPSCPIVQDSS